MDIETILTIIVDRVLAPTPGDLGLLNIKSLSKLFSAQLLIPHPVLYDPRASYSSL